MAFLVSEFTRNIDDISGDSMRLKVVLRCQMSLAPFTGGGVRAHYQHSNRGDGNNNERYDKGHPPCNMGREVTLLYKRVEDGRHQKVGDPTSRIAKTSGQGIRSPDDILVEESS